MPPKVKSVEATTQPAVPMEEPVEETQQATQLVQEDQLTPNDVLSQTENNPSAEPTLLETPPRRGRPKANRSSAKKVRPTMASLVALEIADDLEVHAFVVQRVLESLEKVAVKHLDERGVFHTNLFTAKIRTPQGSSSGRAAVRLREGYRRKRKTRKANIEAATNQDPEAEVHVRAHPHTLFISWTFPRVLIDMKEGGLTRSLEHGRVLELANVPCAAC